MLDQKGREIAISVGVKAAVDLAAQSSDPVAYFKEIVEDIVGCVLDTHEVFSATDAVKQAFPGTEVLTSVIPPFAAVPPSVAPSVQIPVGNVVAFPQQHAAYTPAPAPVAAPQAIPGATDGDPDTDALWREFFADCQAGRMADRWFDNRASKPKQTSPDFRAKGKDRTNTGLWIKSNGKNPSWVLPALQSLGLA